MTDPTPRPTIEELVVPDDLDGPDAAGFTAMIALANELCRHDAGHDHFVDHAAEALPLWQDRTDRVRRGWLARRGGDVVGAVVLTLATEEGARTAEFDVFAAPDPWTTGVEDALVDVAEEAARAAGRSVVQTWTLHRGDSLTRGAELLASPTGFGAVPRDDPQTAFFLRRGYAFAQAERNSVFDLHGSFDEVDRLLAEALRTAGPEYRVVAWTSPTPPEHAEGFADVLSRMATDAPAADLEIDEEVWDAARVHRRDERMRQSGETVSVAAVLHEPSGRLVAYNELVIGEDRAGTTHQFGTLVVREHRGHRLGTVVKCTNLRRWHDLVPASPRVSTFNAEENRPMLDVNEALGFVPASYAAAWQRELGPA